MKIPNYIISFLLVSSVFSTVLLLGKIFQQSNIYVFFLLLTALAIFYIINSFYLCYLLNIAEDKVNYMIAQENKIFRDMDFLDYDNLSIEDKKIVDKYRNKPWYRELIESLSWLSVR